MPLNHSARVKFDADTLLKSDGIEAILKHAGEVVYSGSYALDLMVWNDIDLYVIPKKNKSPEQCAAQLAAMLAVRNDVDFVKVEKNIWKRMPAVPNGVYVGVKIPKPGYKLEWKLDIWIVGEEERAKNKKLLADILRHLDEPKRKLIIEAKLKLMGDQGRTPSMSSVHVYRAVLEMGLTSVDEVIAFITSLGESHRKSTRLN